MVRVEGNGRKPGQTGEYGRNEMLHAMVPGKVDEGLKRI
jgi:hypothetical protein